MAERHNQMRKVKVALAFYFYNSFITNIPFYCIRHWYLRSILRIRIGKKSAIHMGCFFAGRYITIGNNTVINRNCHLDGRVGIKIGNNVSISPETYILSLDHDTQSPTFQVIPKKTVINDYNWIGVRAIILPGVTLMKGSVVGAGAVVTRSTEPYDIVAGVPAKKIGERNKALNYTLHYFPLFNSDIL